MFKILTKEEITIGKMHIYKPYCDFQAFEAYLNMNLEGWKAWYE